MQLKVVNPWLNSADTIKEIKDRRQPVDYHQIAAQARVLFLAEDHFNHAIRQHLVRHAADLREAGITHYAIEADEAGNVTFEKLGGNEPVDLSRVDVGPGRADHEEAIKAISAQGIAVRAIDVDKRSSLSGEDREVRLEENINRLLQEDSNNKVAVLIGRVHTSRNTDMPEGIPSVGKRLMKAGVPTTNVIFTGGESRIPKVITDAAVGAALANQEFMLDFRSYANLKHVPFGEGEADWVIHLPQQNTPSDNNWTLVDHRGEQHLHTSQLWW